MKTIFVTVGTTLFEALTEAATTETALDWMVQAGYTNLILQYGKGRRPSLPEKYNNDDSSNSTNNNKPLLQIEMYTFKPSLADDMERADLIVSHAGAGTVMEVLRMSATTTTTTTTSSNNNNNTNISTRSAAKRLAVVINTQLMDNHQTELAHAMGTRRHLYVLDEPGLLLGNNDTTTRTWKALEDFVPEPYHGGDEHDFPRLLDRFLGFAKDE